MCGLGWLPVVQIFDAALRCQSEDIQSSQESETSMSIGTGSFFCTIQSVADLHSKILDAPPPPPGGPNSFNFMQFLGKFGKIVCWRPPSPGELAPPPRGNPGSATDTMIVLGEDFQLMLIGQLHRKLQN